MRITEVHDCYLYFALCLHVLNEPRKDLDGIAEMCRQMGMCQWNININMKYDKRKEASVLKLTNQDVLYHYERSRKSMHLNVKLKWWYIKFSVQAFTCESYFVNIASTLNYSAPKQPRFGSVSYYAFSTTDSSLYRVVFLLFFSYVCRT